MMINGARYGIQGTSSYEISIYVSDDTTKLGLFLLRYKDKIIDSSMFWVIKQFNYFRLLTVE